MDFRKANCCLVHCLHVKILLTIKSFVINQERALNLLFQRWRHSNTLNFRQDRHPSTLIFAYFFCHSKYNPLFRSYHYFSVFDILRPSFLRDFFTVKYNPYHCGIFLPLRHFNLPKLF